MSWITDNHTQEELDELRKHFNNDDDGPQLKNVLGGIVGIQGQEAEDFAMYVLILEAHLHELGVCVHNTQVSPHYVYELNSENVSPETAAGLIFMFWTGKLVVKKEGE